MNYRTQNGWTSKRGAFINGVWHCDCEPRMPAQKLQTKNGGKNHGRWFYTCQKSQPKRCSFFLWQDDGKVREESAVLSDSRPEPGHTPQTPTKRISSTQAPLTPQSKDRLPIKENDRDLRNTPAGRKNAPTPENDDPFQWPSSDEAELAQAAAETIMAPPLDTPRKTPRTDLLTSPGKRSHSDIQASATSTLSALKPSDDDDVFATPATSSRSNGLLSPTTTPLQIASHLENPSQPVAIDPSNSTLATEVFKILAHIPVSSTVEAQLVALLNNHDLRTQGIARGRDISRLAIQSKDKKIAELQARIAALEAERETSRTVIAHLKRDIGVKASSTKRGRRRFVPQNRSPGKT